MTLARFADIPQLPRAYYEVDVPWEYVNVTLERWSAGMALNLDPDYQRAHVWTPVQQVMYIEYMLQGGEVGRNITFNCPNWMRGGRDRFELVDGKQRIEAVRAFLRDDIPAFFLKRSQYEDALVIEPSFRFRVCTLKTRVEILNLYLNINAGGTPHTEEELDRVRALLAKELESESAASTKGSE